jgi:hypothetical protein
VRESFAPMFAKHVANEGISTISSFSYHRHLQDEEFNIFARNGNILTGEAELPASTAPSMAPKPTDESAKDPSSPPSLSPALQNFNYRSCTEGHSFKGFAKVEFFYDVETNRKSFSSEMEEDLSSSLSLSMLERLIENTCSLPFGDPPLQVESISTGSKDEVIGVCEPTQENSKGCSRYLGSLLVGLNDTIFDEDTTDLYMLFLPIVAKDMMSGLFQDEINDVLETLIRITRIAYIGVPVYGEKKTNNVATQGSFLEFWEGFTMLGKGLFIFCSIFFIFTSLSCCYIYKRIPKEEKIDNSTVLMEEGEPSILYEYDEEDSISSHKKVLPSQESPQKQEVLQRGAAQLPRVRYISSAQRMEAAQFQRVRSNASSEHQGTSSITQVSTSPDFRNFALPQQNSHRVFPPFLAEKAETEQIANLVSAELRRTRSNTSRTKRMMNISPPSPIKNYFQSTPLEKQSFGQHNSNRPSPRQLSNSEAVRFQRIRSTPDNFRVSVSSLQQEQKEMNGKGSLRKQQKHNRLSPPVWEEKGTTEFGRRRQILDSIGKVRSEIEL